MFATEYLVGRQATVGAHQRFYIAAQSPLPHTVSALWQTVWEADVYLVIALLDDPNTYVPYCPSAADRCLEAGEVIMHLAVQQT